MSELIDARPLHPDSVPVAWRSTSRVDDLFCDIGVTFTRYDGEVLRLRLDVESARQLSGSLNDFLRDYEIRSQSLSTRGSDPVCTSQNIHLFALRPSAGRTDAQALQGICKFSYLLRIGYRACWSFSHSQLNRLLLKSHVAYSRWCLSRKVLQHDHSIANKDASLFGWEAGFDSGLFFTAIDRYTRIGRDLAHIQLERIAVVGRQVCKFAGTFAGRTVQPLLLDRACAGGQLNNRVPTVRAGEGNSIQCHSGFVSYWSGDYSQEAVPL